MSTPCPLRALRGPLAATLLCAGAALGGCAGGLQSVYTTNLWVEPGKYEFLKCPDLAQRSLADSAREKDLMSLMERANQEAAGPLINFGVYDVQLKQLRADLDLLQQTSLEKGCKGIVPGAKK